MSPPPLLAGIHMNVRTPQLAEIRLNVATTVEERPFRAA
jgi:hypothetical protein